MPSSFVNSVSKTSCIHRRLDWLKPSHDQGGRSAIVDLLPIFSCLHLFPCAVCGSCALSIGFITVRPKRLMEESQTKDGHRTTTASGGSSAPSPLVSLHSRKRLRGRMPSPPRQWKREEAPWHRDKGTTEQQTPAGPRPFLPAAGPLPFRPAAPRPFLPAAGPLPFLPALVLLGSKSGYA
jgi:hypothetical protein